jgi:hypothetical protein
VSRVAALLLMLPVACSGSRPAPGGKASGEDAAKLAAWLHEEARPCEAAARTAPPPRKGENLPPKDEAFDALQKKAEALKGKQVEGTFSVREVVERGGLRLARLNPAPGPVNEEDRHLAGVVVRGGRPYARPDEEGVGSVVLPAGLEPKAGDRLRVSGRIDRADVDRTFGNHPDHGAVRLYLLHLHLADCTVRK